MILASAEASWAGEEDHGRSDSRNRELEGSKHRNNWAEDDFVQLGRRVGAEMVVAVEFSAYSIHEGATLYQGRSGVIS